MLSRLILNKTMITVLELTNPTGLVQAMHLKTMKIKSTTSLVPRLKINKSNYKATTRRKL